jgi:hypothetical protein
MADVAALFRYPVKSMGGERVDRVELTERGVAGDRSHAVVDRSDGRVVTGKHPRKWGRILELSAAYVDGDPTAPLTVTFPDGAEVRGDAPSLDGRLSAFLGAEVTLTSSATSVVAEEVWPADVEGLAPMDVVASMGDGRREGDDLVTDIPVASMAPPGTFFDLTTLHVLTEATLQRLAELDPEADFDIRRGPRRPPHDALRAHHARPAGARGGPPDAQGDRPPQPRRDPRDGHLGVRRRLRERHRRRDAGRW